jgi:glycosyltransferase involved in cell wall biosynthesis
LVPVSARSRPQPNAARLTRPKPRRCSTSSSSSARASQGHRQIASLRLHFLIPGDLHARTGGYAYDRRIAEGLRALGWQVCLHRLDGSFPAPTVSALGDARERLGRIPDGELALIDGLALGVMGDLVASERQRLRLVGLVHHPLADETGLTPARASALRAAEVRALGKVHRIVATSRATRRRLAEMGLDPEQVAVIEPGTDPAPLAVRSGQPPLQLLSVGAMIARKGHLTLIDALAALKEHPWTLRIVGSLDRDPTVVAQARDRIARSGLEERVILTGELDEAALEQAYQQADVFVLASLFEGYGMAFAEALARGLPIVGSGGGAVRQTVPASAGLLAEPGSSQALSGALGMMLSDPERRQACSRGAERARANLPDWPSRCRHWSETLSHV